MALVTENSTFDSRMRSIPQTRRQVHPIPTVKFYDVKRLLEDKTAEPTAFGTYGDTEDDSELDARE
ncbi:hypothetical protein EIP86_009875 [Pleurotus ostreatoroseus]|nr:hypothetical protein EIP86_009875 [Pleurotus ostreatoroseus]